MQPLAAPPRRGATVAIVLLVVAFLATSTIAVIQYVELRQARDRIEELEAQVAGDPQGGGLFGDFGQALEDALDQVGESLGGAGGLGDLGCLFPDRPFSAPPIGQVGLEEQVRAIAEQVERIRGLEFTEPVAPEFVSPEESSDMVQDLFLDEYTPAIGDAESRVLAALGAIPDGMDLRQVRADLLGQQVAGFYDPETGQLVVRQAGAELTATDRVVVAHELDHALTDQALGLPVPDDIRQGREDADLAATALIEGDATLLMQLYSGTVPLDEQLSALDPEALGEALQAQTDLADLPPYLASELTFPYEEGLTFVCHLYERGGWEAVDQAYRDPPDASVEILVPDLYREGFDPIDPADPGGLRPPWRAATTMEFGAAPLLWLLQAPGGDPSRGLPDARAVAESWGGGQLHLWTRGEDTAVALVLAERPAAGDLCVPMTEWYRNAEDGDREAVTKSGGLESDGQQQDAVISCTRDGVRIGLAPDLRTARGLVR